MDNQPDYTIPLSEIVARFPGHLFWKDRDGVYLGCNLEQALSVNLKSASELIGKTDFDILDRERAEYSRQIDLEVMRSGETHISEEEVVLFGEKRIFVAKKAPLRNQMGVVVGVIGTSVDITKQKNQEIALRAAMEKAELASQAKSEFIANMSHDLRTPLSGIQALAENIMTSSDDPELTYNGQLLLSASGDLLQLIDSILEVVRTDSTAFDRPDTAFRLRRLLNNVIHILSPNIKEKQIDFRFQCDERLPELLSGQPLMLQRILMNLLSNALKFTEERGTINLSVSLESLNNVQCEIRFEVNDTGVGIPNDKLDIIFEKFSRISESYKGRYKGTGMGLYMVKQYIDRMHGEISVSSGNQGTVFTAYIPFALAQAATDAQDGDVASTASLPNNVRILLVEDNVIAQHSQSTKFQALGCEVMIAETGKAALEQFKEDEFDLLVIDLGLPDIDGWTLAQRFRGDTMNANSLSPIVILTAHADPEEALEQHLKDLPSVIIKRKPLMDSDASELLAKVPK